MKRHNILFALLVTVMSSCAGYVDIVPDDVATIEYAFRDRVKAERFLATCYSYIPDYGNPARDPAIMASDETWNFINMTEASSSVGNYSSFYIKMGLQNSNSPYINYWDGENYGINLWEGIRNCNIFLESADLVGPQLAGAEKEQWKAEAKFLKAFYHYFLMRMYGPIPLMRENMSIEATTEEVKVYREPLDECVDYVVGLIDEAVPYLPLQVVDPSTETGHITQAIALAIKAEILMTFASPLFNGNTEFAYLTDNRGIKLFPQSYDKSKWERAAIACKNAIDTCLLAGHKLFVFNDPTYTYQLTEETILQQSLRCAASERFNQEMIWASSKSGSNNYQSHTMPFFEASYHNAVPWRGFIVPTFKMADLYYSENGVPIEEDPEFDYNDRFSISVPDPATHKYKVQPNVKTAKINQNREARYYANLAFDGGYWYGNGRYGDVGAASNTALWSLKMKQGEAMGKSGSLRYSITGYWAKKPSNIRSTVTSSGGASLYRYSFPIIRLADLYLYYAEALNEIKAAPDEEVYEYIDLVRERAGLRGVVESWAEHSVYPEKPSTQEGMREIIQRERMIELSFEGKRFWDLRRWRIAHEVVPGLIQSWNINANDEAEYWIVNTIDNISYRNRDYLWPIKDYAIRVNGNLVQNPNW